jgi:TNF receptor-associated protein 1
MSFLRHIIKTNNLQREKVGDFYSVVSLNLEINPRNGLIKALYSMHKKDPELAKAIAEQLMDNSLVTAGLVEDPRLVISNLNKLLEKAFAAKPAY